MSMDIIGSAVQVTATSSRKDSQTRNQSMGKRQGEKVRGPARDRRYVQHHKQDRKESSSELSWPWQRWKGSGNQDEDTGDHKQKRTPVSTVSRDGGEGQVVWIHLHLWAAFTPFMWTWKQRLPSWSTCKQGRLELLDFDYSRCNHLLSLATKVRHCLRSNKEKKQLRVLPGNAAPCGWGSSGFSDLTLWPPGCSALTAAVVLLVNFLNEC